ncbi:MAG: hypothetical protein HXS46_05640 [Theionarchaea archaeon]|nr:MAG: hypothetical protein AYK18_11945 [Theionarchaea archaeon DG-70]MBU7010152.1 hypothetical protein [Theionarchaea archaeon]
MDMKRPFYQDVSFWVLIFSNLLTAGIAAKENWSLITLMMAYWLQSCIIGVFNFARILSVKEFSAETFFINKKPVLSGEYVKIFAAIFFVFHYGFFHLVYAVFLLFFAFTSDSAVNITHILIAGGIFLVDHAFSFSYNRKRDEKRTWKIPRLMFFPYARVIPMHFVIIAYGVLSPGKELLYLFLGLKTAADAVMHVIEHG